MSKKVSGKTHTKQQLDNYANQHNPNNKAYQANKQNQRSQKAAKQASKHEFIDYDYSGFGPYYFD